ncbi:MAG: hypothetical protein IJ031_00025 [Oscillospiraceae bacterium]|nr:hypothetical protein [Oscillospiraceae bacterium]MBQ8378607.1 hypothetical protein [Oscillospiraceae bacterium]MBQ8882976.1 hypothetical protein [Oscillospiraceae bacterium]
MATKKETVEKVKETAKKTAKKTTETAKKVADKATKAAKPAVEKATKAAKPVVEKAAKVAKPAAKKVASTAKKAAAKVVKEELIVEFGGKSVNMADVVENVKKAWKADGNKGMIKKVQVYVKPEENVAYYVVNDIAEGKKIDL